MKIKIPFMKQRDKTRQPFVNEKQRVRAQDIAEAKRKLRMSRIQNEEVIEMTLRNIRYNERHNINASSAKYVSKIKKAFYAIQKIEDLQLHIDEMQTTQQLFEAMNNITSATALMNRVYRKSDKPKTGRYERQAEKLADNMEDANERLAELYQTESENMEERNIDSLVDDMVVTRLREGHSIDDCLREFELDEEGAFYSGVFGSSPDSFPGSYSDVDAGGENGGSLEMNENDTESNREKIDLG